MNEPISSLFVFSVVYCVVFKQTLKQYQAKTEKQTEININKTEKLREKHDTKHKYRISSSGPDRE